MAMGGRLAPPNCSFSFGNWFLYSKRDTVTVKKNSAETQTLL